MGTIMNCGFGFIGLWSCMANCFRYLQSFLCHIICAPQKVWKCLDDELPSTFIMKMNKKSYWVRSIFIFTWPISRTRVLNLRESFPFISSSSVLRNQFRTIEFRLFVDLKIDSTIESVLSEQITKSLKTNNESKTFLWKTFSSSWQGRWIGKKFFFPSHEVWRSFRSSVVERGKYLKLILRWAFIFPTWSVDKEEMESHERWRTTIYLLPRRQTWMRHETSDVEKSIAWNVVGSAGLCLH